LNRTPATTTNQTTFTWSGWVKRGTLGGDRCLFFAGANGTYWFTIQFSSDVLRIFSSNSGGGATIDVSTPAVYRDPSSWYHIVLKIDSTQATAANRVILYVNNVQQLLTVGTQIAQNQVTSVNTNVIHTIGRLNYATTNYFDGYMAEVNFVDGLALTPNYFGQTDTTSGAWQPVAYTGLYGTNGFYLPFTNTTNTNAYIDRNATVGQKYRYSVSVKCNNPNPPNTLFKSTESFSNQVTALEPPDAPRNLAAVAGNNRITYTWNAPSDNTWDDPNDSNPDLVIAGYALVVKLVGSATTLTPVTIEASGNSYSYTVSGLTNGSAYVAEVTSFVSSNSTKVYSQSVSFTGSQTPYGPALAITSLSCAASTSNEAKNTLTWDGSVNLLLNGGDFVDYSISRTSTTDASSVILTRITNQALRSYVDSSCTPGVTYTYSFFITTKDKNSATTVNGATKSVAGMPSSQPDIYDISGNGSVLTVRFYQNGSKVINLLAVGIATSSSQNMVQQITNIDIPLGSTNALQSYSVTLGSPAYNGGLVVIGNSLGFAYQVLRGDPPLLIDGSSGNAPTVITTPPSA
jgi:hypothetical protein